MNLKIILLILNLTVITISQTKPTKYTELYPIIDSKLNYFGYPSSIYFKANILNNISFLKPMKALYYGYKVPTENNYSELTPNENILLTEINISSNLSVYVLLDFVILNYTSSNQDQIKFNKISYDADLKFLLEMNNIEYKKIPNNFSAYYPDFQKDFQNMIMQFNKEKK